MRMRMRHRRSREARRLTRLPRISRYQIGKNTIIIILSIKDPAVTTNVANTIILRHLLRLHRRLPPQSRRREFQDRKNSGLARPQGRRPVNLPPLHLHLTSPPPRSYLLPHPAQTGRAGKILLHHHHPHSTFFPLKCRGFRPNCSQNLINEIYECII